MSREKKIMMRINTRTMREKGGGRRKKKKTQYMQREGDRVYGKEKSSQKQKKCKKLKSVLVS